MTDTIFLTPDELSELTDRKQAAKQIQWLLANGYPFERSASGRPKVLRSVVLNRLGQKHQVPQTGPDVGAISDLIERRKRRHGTA